MYDSQFHGTWKASAYYKNPEVDALLRKARARSSRRSARRSTRRRSARSWPIRPDIWIYNSMQLQGLNKRVKGRRFCTVGQGAEMRWMQLGLDVSLHPRAEGLASDAAS